MVFEMEGCMERRDDKFTIGGAVGSLVGLKVLSERERGGLSAAGSRCFAGK